MPAGASGGLAVQRNLKIASDAQAARETQQGFNQEALNARNLFETPQAAPRKEVKFHGAGLLQTLLGVKGASGFANPTGANGQITIWIPHLPPDLDLSRENSFIQSGNTMVTPDGLPVYEYTSPLKIPMEFTLSAYDELCDDGCYTLLDLAARLHSLLLPSSNDDSILASAKSAPPTKTAAGGSVELNASLNSRGTINNSDKLKAFVDAATNSQSFKTPQACRLQLLQAGPNGFGVNCTGYVESVKTVLHGPYLSGQSGSSVFNLPSSVTYGFVFVHSPSYTNVLKSKFVNAFGPDIYTYFYNLAHLAEKAQIDYQGLDALSPERRISG